MRPRLKDLISNSGDCGRETRLYTLAHIPGTPVYPLVTQSILYVLEPTNQLLPAVGVASLNPAVQGFASAGVQPQPDVMRPQGTLRPAKELQQKQAHSEQGQ